MCKISRGIIIIHCSPDLGVRKRFYTEHPVIAVESRAGQDTVIPIEST